jgi:exosortase/archaeosortase family protein
MGAPPGDSGKVASPLPWAGRRFVVTFAAIATGLFALYYFPYQENGLSERWASLLLETYAHAVGAVLRLFEPGVTVSGNVIAGRFGMSIVKSCDAMEANMLFAAAVLALPFAWWRKGAALLVGLAALVAMNVLRLFCLYYVGVYLPARFEVMHIDVWPVLMIAFTVLDFYLCIRWLEGPARSERADPNEKEGQPSPTAASPPPAAAS